MSLATLVISPVLEENQDVWAFSNSDHHKLIIRAIRSQLGVQLQDRALDPMPRPEDDVALQFWLQKHQASHNDFTAPLGIEGADLTDLEFKNPDNVRAWAFLHASDHRLAAIELGI